MLPTVASNHGLGFCLGFLLYYMLPTVASKCSYIGCYVRLTQVSDAMCAYIIGDAMCAYSGCYVRLHAMGMRGMVGQTPLGWACLSGPG